MIRKIIRIDEDKCTGCGICAEACHEGAIDIVDGKAKLMREHYCDGLGDCLPACPTGAISFEEREAPAYDEAAVKASQEAKKQAQAAVPHHGCPGSRAQAIRRRAAESAPTASQEKAPIQSELSQWPVQIKLVPIKAPYFDGANILIAADCTAYAYADFHRKFIRNRITLIGCPKLDEGDYTEKLQAIFESNDIRSVTIVRMEVPCCGGIERAAKNALQRSGKFVPWQVYTVGINGELLDK